MCPQAKGSSLLLASTLKPKHLTQSVSRRHFCDGGERARLNRNIVRIVDHGHELYNFGVSITHFWDRYEL